MLSGWGPYLTGNKVAMKDAQKARNARKKEEFKNFKRNLSHMDKFQLENELETLLHNDGVGQSFTDYDNVLQKNVRRKRPGSPGRGEKNRIHKYKTLGPQIEAIHKNMAKINRGKMDADFAESMRRAAEPRIYEIASYLRALFFRYKRHLDKKMGMAHFSDEEDDISHYGTFNPMIYEIKPQDVWYADYTNRNSLPPISDPPLGTPIYPNQMAIFNRLRRVLWTKNVKNRRHLSKEDSEKLVINALGKEAAQYAEREAINELNSQIQNYGGKRKKRRKSRKRRVKKKTKSKKRKSKKRRRKRRKTRRKK